MASLLSIFVPLQQSWRRSLNDTPSHRPYPTQTALFISGTLPECIFRRISMSDTSEVKEKMWSGFVGLMSME